MSKSPNPMFIHDCKHCRLLGTINHAPIGWGDLYVCEGMAERGLDVSLGRSVIFRWSDEGRDYTSIPESMADSLKEGHVLRYAASLANPAAV